MTLLSVRKYALTLLVKLTTSKEKYGKAVVKISKVKWFNHLDIVWCCKIGIENSFLNMQFHLHPGEDWCKYACVFANHCHKSDCSLPRHSMQTIHQVLAGEKRNRDIKEKATNFKSRLSKLSFFWVQECFKVKQPLTYWCIKWCAVRTWKLFFGYWYHSSS